MYPNPAPATKANRARVPRPLATLLLLLLALLIGPGAVAAGDVDLTLAGTYQFGGTFELLDSEFGFVDFEVEDSGGRAVFLGIPVNRALQIELLAVQQETEVAIDEGLFTPDFVVGDLDLSYYHAGIAWHFPIGQLQPYVAVSTGITRFEFDIPGVEDDSYFSVSIGGGFKARFTEHLGLRLDGRLFVTNLDDDFYDDDRCRRCDYEGESMTQGAISAGLLLTF